MTADTETIFATILTKLGRAKLTNAMATGQTIQLTQMAFGDGGGSIPELSESATALVNEVHRAPIARVIEVDANTRDYEGLIPGNIGGFYIREAAIFDAAGDIFAIATVPPTLKTSTANNVMFDQAIRLRLHTTNSEATTLVVDPYIVIASQKYVDGAVSAAFDGHAAGTSHAHPIATTKVAGLVEFATMDEAADASNATHAINPATLHPLLAALLATIPEVDLSGLLAKAQNLADVVNKPTARDNLDVYSKGDVNTLLSKLNVTAHVQEQLPDGTSAPAAVAGAWTDRAVALVETSDPAEYVSVSGDTFTLLQGVYEVVIRSPYFYTGGFRARLFCTSTNAAVPLSMSENGGSGNTQVYNANMYVESRFRLVVPDGGATYKLQYYAQIAYPYGLGTDDRAANGNEVYATTTLTKVG